MLSTKDISYSVMSGTGWINEPFYSEIKKLMPLPCVDLLIVNKGRLLLMKRNNSPANGLWFTPGGRIRKGESIETAVIRKLKEETALEPISIKQAGVMSHVWPKVQTITVFYIVHVLSDKIVMNDEHSDYKWIKSVEEDTHPYIVYMINESKIFK